MMHSLADAVLILFFPSSSGPDEDDDLRDLVRSAEPPPLIDMDPDPDRPDNDREGPRGARVAAMGRRGRKEEGRGVWLKRTDGGHCGEGRQE